MVMVVACLRLRGLQPHERETNVRKLYSLQSKIWLNWRSEFIDFPDLITNFPPVFLTAFFLFKKSLTIVFEKTNYVLAL